MPLCYSLKASRVSVLLSHLDFHFFEDETIISLCLLLSVHTNSGHQGKAGRWVSGGQEVPWQDSRCRWTAQGPGRLPWEAPSATLQGGTHLADSFHSIWSPSCCRVSISVKRVGLGASSSSPRMSWSCSAAGDPAKGGQRARLSALWEVKALEMEQKPRARGKYFLFSKTKPTFQVKLELDVGGCGWDILPDKRDERI